MKFLAGFRFTRGNNRGLGSACPGIYDLLAILLQLDCLHFLIRCSRKNGLGPAGHVTFGIHQVFGLAVEYITSLCPAKGLLGGFAGGILIYVVKLQVAASVFSFDEFVLAAITLSLAGALAGCQVLNFLGF